MSAPPIGRRVPSPARRILRSIQYLRKTALAGRLVVMLGRGKGVPESHRGASSLLRALAPRDPPVAQLDDPIPVARVFLRVRHLDDRRAGRVQLPEQFHDLASL